MTELERELLSALKKALTALNWARRFQVPCLNTDSYEIAAELDRVIKKAESQ